MSAFTECANRESDNESSGSDHLSERPVIQSQPMQLPRDFLTLRRIPTFRYA